MSYTDAIDQLSRLIRQLKKGKLRSYGLRITIEQWAILEQLKLTPGISQIALSDFVDKDPAAVMRTLNLLESKGLVLRESLPGNRRNHSLFVTEAGKSILHKLWPVAIDIRALGNKGITSSELEEFVRMLAVLKANFES